MGGTAMRQRECVAMNGGRDERLRPAVAVVDIPLLVGRPIMLDLEHKPISLLNKKNASGNHFFFYYNIKKGIQFGIC